MSCFCSKIFVGGLSWETSKDSLKTYFGGYGEVTDCVIMEDPATKNPRGFGFVTFKDQESVLSVINHPTAHMLDSKKVRMNVHVRVGVLAEEV